ncbi:hypothetical protein NFI96_026477 [Prochilodus magdalenae]|nr:hypothetical protein NFI96_026477 [Prochilodus magdalenae]
MDSYKRFRDKEYKNWLKSAENLYILRSSLRDFVEKKTETYHSSLRAALQEHNCVQKCKKYQPTQKKSPQLCASCERWKDAILQRHSAPKNIHWENVEPHLWPTDQWEVAKVYMPGGQNKHRCFEDFDISAILNFMSNCKLFNTLIKKDLLLKVISLRNTVMHSPDFRLKEDRMKQGLKDIKTLAQHLEPHIPNLQETISDKIKQFDTVLENYPGQVSPPDGKKDNLELLDREQQALKEKIEFLTQRYEANQHAEIKEEVQGMKNFLDQNKDVLENLRPQVDKLNVIQEMVDKHELQIDNLSNRVDNLEKDTHDPMFSSDPLKFKNHLIEQTRKRKWDEPLFTEELEASGYRGRVKVNGQSFVGLQVCNNKKSAHQEVAKQALDYFKDEFESTEEASTSADTTSSKSSLFYSTVTIVFRKDVCSDGYVEEEEAVESAYMKLARQFGLNDPGDDKDFRTAVLSHFNKYGIQPPSETLNRQDDKNVCTLKLTECPSFCDKDGSTTKKKAEQQAAKVALEHLSGFLNCGSVTDVNENYKGFLKERLDALGMENPEYKTEQKKPTGDERSSSTSRGVEQVSSIQPRQQEQENTNLQSKDIVTIVQHPPTIPSDCAAVGVMIQTGDSGPSPIAKTAIMEDHTGSLFYSTVTIVFRKDVSSDGYVQEEEAVESAYMKLARQFGLNDPGDDKDFRTAVLSHFNKYGIQPPSETLNRQDDKNVCTLKLTECLSFCDKDGSTTKKKAEQQAAKVALEHLSGFLNCGSVTDVNENYKGFLKERLDALGMENPEYKTERKKPTGDERSSSTSRGVEQVSSIQPRQQGQENAILQTKAFNQGTVTVVQPPPTTPPDCAAAGLMTESQEPNPSMPGEAFLEDVTEISSLLAVYNLKSPSVTVERIRADQNINVMLNINLDKFTFENSNAYTSKKDAIRKTYGLLGHALGITQLNQDNAMMLVKQDFSQKSQTYPKEIVSGDKDFYCSLREITYSLVYEGQGSTEAEAKQDALKKALTSLPFLFGHGALPMSSSTEEAEHQINNLLKMAQQKDLTFSPKHHQHKITVDLQFQDYTIVSNSQKTKKENCKILSKRILRLLGEETEPNCPSLRNCLDDWFKQKALQQPVFENTEEAQGSKATFSVTLSCSHPNWEDSLEEAKKKVVNELKKRLQHLAGQSEMD